MIELKNPHSALAAIEKRPQDVVEVRIRAGQAEGAWQEVARSAGRAGIPVSTGSGGSESRGRRSKNREPKSERVGVGVVLVKENPGLSLDAFLESVATADDDSPTSGLWLALDCLQDPHNVGAVFRTAGFFGVRGILVTRDRSAPLNATVYDVAAGGLECVPFCVVPNLSRRLEKARQAGLWLLGTSEHADQSLENVQPDRPWLLILGNEEKGLRRLTLDNCDQVCGIASRGGVTSLNVSVAAAVCIAHLSRPPSS